MYKKFLSLFILAVIFTSCSIKPLKYNFSSSKSSISSYTATNRNITSSYSGFAESSQAKIIASVKKKTNNKIKAIWISYLELDPILNGKTKKQFKDSFDLMMSKAKSIGLNTVIVQVRPFADAVYDSDIFPYSSVQGGKKLSFDPLKIMIKSAHAKKLAFHAWVNPLRGTTKSELKKLSSGSRIKKLYSTKNDKIFFYDGRWYFNPAYSDVRRLICDGVSEIIKKYNVEAIHIDDYFYPSSSKKIDSYSYKKYGKGKSLSDFRIDNCNKMVKSLYKSVKSSNRNVEFGISPQGNINNNYKIGADVKLWCSKSGYCDYIMPQLYYGFKNTNAPFKATANEWISLCSKNNNIKLYFGLACHKIGMKNDKNAGKGYSEWYTNKNIIKRQVKFSLNTTRVSGFSLYSYKSIFNSKGNYLNNRVKNEISGLNTIK